MQDLQLVLIGIGGLAIAGLVAHGVWASKRESKNQNRYLEKANENAIGETTLEQANVEIDDPLFDGNTKIDNERADSDLPKGATSPEINQDPTQNQALQQNQETEQPFIKVHKSPMSLEQAQHKANEAAKAYEQSRAETEAELDQQANQKLQEQKLAEQRLLEQKLAEQKLAEQKLQEQRLAEQRRVEQQRAQQALAEQQRAEEQARLAAEQARIEAEKAAEPNAVIFHVKASGEDAFDGQALVACMRKYGLSFGKNDIFHCYENGDPQNTLFSIANMAAPGTFPASPMADFDTKGILLFMLLPSDENAEQHFKRMLLTAQQIADDLGGHVLDDKRNLMTPNRLDKYRQQIRESLSPQA